MVASMKETREPVIRAEKISFSYVGHALALDHIDFTVREGEFVAFLASNGAGKTTFLKVLVGLLKPGKGRVRLHGKDIKGLSTGEICREVGFVLQNPTDQLFAATVEEDVAAGPRNMGLPEDEVERRVAEALELVSVAHLRKRAIHHISHGEQKRVSIAGIIAMNPSTLILDEPTAGLDPEGEASMLRTLNRLNREHGKTIILATHSVDMLPLFADRIVIMNRGRILQDGSPEEVFADREMLSRAHLRLPYISRLLYELRHLDGAPIDSIPLTIGEARCKLLELIPEDRLIRGVEGEEV
jgi:cobalt/nickel transport system ATP-binding protein